MTSDHPSIFSPAPSVPPLAYRPRAAALALGVSERQLSRWIREHIIPVVRIGRVRLIPVHLLRDWLTAQATPATTTTPTTPEAGGGKAVQP